VNHVCRACGRSFQATAQAPDAPFTCDCAPDGHDRVLTPTPDLGALRFPTAPEANPFVAYRRFLSAHGLGLPDADYVALVERLDAAITRVDGAGFRATPFAPRADAVDGVQVWIKDETGHVAGSHKARHLMGVLLHLEVTAALGWRKGAPRLAIASCGNAALAAAVLARAAERPLTVYIPPDADPAVVARLESLRATIQVCARQPGEAGDPCYLRFVEDVAAGALPFCCQGPANGITLEGGKTIAYEMGAALNGQALDHVVIQVGGGAFASAIVTGLRELVVLGVLPRMPRVHTVQTTGAAPLARAADRVRARADEQGLDAALAHAATHRAEYMWPWESPPVSVAHGILDDETYDWLTVVDGTLSTGGESLVVSEDALRAARLRAHALGVPASHTGAAGLAGLSVLRERGLVAAGEHAAVVLSGVER
jgi:threonine synthase